MAVASSTSLLAAMLFTVPFKYAPASTASATIHRAFDFMCSPVICCFDGQTLPALPLNTASGRMLPGIYVNLTNVPRFMHEESCHDL